MNITMNDLRIDNITQLRSFLEGTKKIDLSLRDAPLEEKYQFIDQTVDRFNYPTLPRKDKRVVISYLKKVTRYKSAQLTRLIRRAKVGKLLPHLYVRRNPNRKYSSADIKLLEKTDEVHLRLNSLATKAILEREAVLFTHPEYETISQVSTSHLHNLRNHPVYKNNYFNHTKPSSVPIGVCEKPDPKNRPGTLRADTVHQRDIYYINTVDEVTQWEIVVCVPSITDTFMEMAMLEIVKQCPFVMTGFHSDRGGEFINELLEKTFKRLKIYQTKSRPRRSNDNALVETKNGSVIRKNFGWEHLDRGDCDLINQYLKDWFNPYLNYHRPSLFVTDTVKTKKGRTRKIHGCTTLLTPTFPRWPLS